MSSTYACSLAAVETKSIYWIYLSLPIWRYMNIWNRITNANTRNFNGKFGKKIFRTDIRTSNKHFTLRLSCTNEKTFRHLEVYPITNVTEELVNNSFQNLETIKMTAKCYAASWKSNISPIFFFLIRKSWSFLNTHRYR